MGITDGMGFEEVNQTVTFTEIISGANVYGSTAVTTPSLVSTYLSGTDARLTSVTAIGSITGTLGRLHSIGLGSTAVYGGRIQAGSVATAAGSGGTISFGTPFAGLNYFVVLTGQTAVGSVVAFVSGTRNISGCEIVGGASAPYDYVAVGK